MATSNASAKRGLLLPQPGKTPASRWRRVLPSLALRNKITIPFAVLTLLVAAISTMLVLRLAGGSLEDRLASYAADAASVTGQGLSRVQTEELAALRAVVHTQGVAEAVAAGDSEQLSRLLVPLKMNYGLDAVRVVDDGGVELLGIVHRPDSSRAEDFVVEAKGLNLSGWPLVQDLLAGRTDALGDKLVDIQFLGSRPVLWLGGPVKEGQTTAGAVLVGVYMDKLVRDLTERAAARVTLYDRRGNMLASSLYDTDDAPGLLAGGIPEAVAGSLYLEPGEWQGRQYLLGYAPLVLRGEPAGVFSVAISRDHVVQASLALRTLMIIVFSVTGLLVLVLGYVIAGRIADPLSRLVTTTRRVAAGDLAQRVDLAADDEVGELARAFNQMTGELEKNARRLDQKISDLTVLYEASANLNKTLDLGATLQVATDVVYASMDVRFVLLLLHREDGGWTCRAAKGLDRDTTAIVLRRTWTDLPPGLSAVADKGQPLLLEDGQEVGMLTGDIGLPFSGVAVMALPLNSTGQVIGMILVGRQAVKGFPDAAQNLLFETIATEVAWSIHNAQLYAQVTEKITQMASLQQVSRAISSKLSRQALLDQVVQNVQSVAGARFVTVHLLEPASKNFELAASSRPDLEPRLRALVTKVAELVATEKRPYTSIADGRYVPVAGEMGRFALGDCLCIPIWAESEVVGAIFARRGEGADRFRASDLVVLSTVANQAGVAAKNAILYEDIQRLNQNVVQSLATAIDAKDKYTHGHSHRVAANSVAVGEYMGLGAVELDHLRTAGYLHDIGKIGVADAILLKSTSLTVGERDTIKGHTVTGARILEPVGFDPHLLSGILHHHERLDGRGYPDGLRGEEIPLFGRILCVADSFDAMVSDRPYRASILPRSAILELTRNVGTQFDPRVVEHFVRAFEDGKITLPQAVKAGAGQPAGPNRPALVA